jgi:hypothetical protein
MSLKFILDFIGKKKDKTSASNDNLDTLSKNQQTRK